MQWIVLEMITALKILLTWTKGLVFQQVWEFLQAFPRVVCLKPTIALPVSQRISFFLVDASRELFSIPQHPPLVFMRATWFHNKHQQFVPIVFSSHSVVTSFIGLPPRVWCTDGECAHPHSNVSYHKCCHVNGSGLTSQARWEFCHSLTESSGFTDV